MTRALRPAKKYSKYTNRDLSWLEFNRRVLEEAQDSSTPLLERVKFLSIVSTNLDEFMSVRVAGVMDQIKVGLSKRDFSGYTPSGLLKRIINRTEKLVSDQYKTFRNITHHLAREGIVFTAFKQLDEHQREQMTSYYYDKVFPVLTPMAIDQGRPFPCVSNQNLYLAIILKKEEEQQDDDNYFAILQVPANLPRFIKVRLNKKRKKANLYFIGGFD